MPKKPSPNRVKTHRVYTVYEAADALDLHRQTVIRWIRHHGLRADCSKRPWLIEGRDLKGFLTKRRQKDRVTLKIGEIYCLPCRQAQVPAGHMADFRMKTATSGVLSGICPACDRMMNRIIGRADLEAFRAVLDVTVQQAVTGIVGVSTPCLTVTQKEARRANG
ncbi:helix-turn-helix domain-containing protein [Tropicimonas sp. IMCC6043]|uniref:helix-turn-helix domain-containing protein n=1 Tax=Tropicimonas sp. IMCC6043 TaxID=2510645 RepID=UPI00101C41AB|nr:helix-turn-helix domain-containing protein [Tropicimonas sp. IMCC6043]RYH08454.1 DNA-binding protein [Tropicimonas sp. IMCC6043]